MRRIYENTELKNTCAFAIDGRGQQLQLIIIIIIICGLI